MINLDPDVRFFIRKQSPLTFQILVREPAFGPTFQEYFLPPGTYMDPDTYAAALKKAMDELWVLAQQGKSGTEQAKRRLESIGTNLFDQLPSALQDRLWSLLGLAETVQIISDEPKIPWELMKLKHRKPTGGWESGKYLCEAFAVTRWLIAMTGSLKLPVRDIALVVPRDSELPESQTEREDILALAGSGRRVREIVPVYQKVIEALQAGEHDAWHFCGHGSADATDPDRMIFQLLDGDQLHPEDIKAHGGSLEPRQAFVFLNACETGECGFSLTGLGGWAHAFLHAGAGAFLGTLWSVDDRAASVFAKEFYRRFLGGEPIAEALRQARFRIRDLFPGDPSWLAYTAFAHPFATSQKEYSSPRLEADVESMTSANAAVAAPPDLKICTRTIFQDGKACLEFTLSSPSRALELKNPRFTGSTMSKAELLGLIDRIKRLHRGFDAAGMPLLLKEIEGALDGIGRKLYRDLFPPELKHVYRLFRRHGRSLMFITDEPWTPWELIKPYDDSDLSDIIDDNFLGLQFPLTRWLSGAGEPSQEMRIQRFAFLGSEIYPRSLDEKELLCSFAGKQSRADDVSPTEATVAAFEDLLDSGGSQIFHFAGPFVDRDFRPEDLHGPRATQIRRDRPLVFFNFNSESVDWVRSWVEDCGCGALLYPMSSIKDSHAYEFAATFYAALGRGETLGRAVQEARVRVHAIAPGIPTWLAYTFYAHVNGRLVFGPSEAS